jgi:hexosaminidase
VYAYEPVPAELTAGEARHVLGAQGQLWTEYMPNPKQVEYMAFPRLAALAEVVWTPRERKDFGDFMARLGPHLARLDILDVNYRRLDR